MVLSDAVVAQRRVDVFTIQRDVLTRMYSQDVKIQSSQYVSVYPHVCVLSCIFFCRALLIIREQAYVCRHIYSY